ncbi:cupin domain-containing protein [Tranquillimonas alkanivorans]|uniref:Cupin domain-containing protein n=1 Tax=Tranquillimonas alkanivorans TaxID=441119 RepID=A0A1I5PEK8_9RHOB|nr:cupin domain-containing protein [Tranquillimonas alkanivorans]SFP32475.1 Cupin domain-containing protein [Tranquillimonas alkanivorans]
MTLPVLIRRDDPDVQSWNDARRGVLTFRLLIDGGAGPTAGLCQGTARLDPRGYETAHHHDIAETAHVLSGRGRLRLGDKTFEVEAGDTVHIAPHTVHAWSANDAPLEVFWTFPADRFDDIAYHFENDT